MTAASPVPRCVLPLVVTISYQCIILLSHSDRTWGCGISTISTHYLHSIYNIYTVSTVSSSFNRYTPHLHFPPRAEWEHICEQFNDSMGSCRQADIVRPKLKVCCISIVINWAKLTRWDCGRVHSLVSLKPEKLHHCTVKLRTGAALRTGYCVY